MHTLHKLNTPQGAEKEKGNHLIDVNDFESQSRIITYMQVPIRSWCMNGNLAAMQTCVLNAYLNEMVCHEKEITS